MWRLPSKPELPPEGISMEFHATQFVGHRVDLIDLSFYPRYVEAKEGFEAAFEQLLEKIPDDLRAKLEEFEERALMLKSMSAEAYYLQGVADLLHFMESRPSSQKKDAAT